MEILVTQQVVMPKITVTLRTADDTQRQQHNTVYRYSSHQIHSLRIITPISRNVASPSQRSVKSKRDILSRYVDNQGNAPYRQATGHEVRRDNTTNQCNLTVPPAQNRTKCCSVCKCAFHLDPPKTRRLNIGVH
jgi:hypothetical protein